MVSYVIKLFAKEISGLHQAAYLLAIFAFGSQLLALVRDRMLAHYFGAGEMLDIYYAAFRIPDLIFVIVASLVAISVLVPFLAERIEKGDQENLRKFIDAVFTFFFISVIFLSVIIFFILPYVLPIFFAGFSEGAISTLTIFSRILLLSPIFLGISNLFASITQVHQRFFIYAVSPILYNLGIIIGILFLCPIFGITGVVVGVVVGAFLHMFIQFPFVVHKGLMPRFVNLSGNFDLIKQVAFLSVPRTVTIGISQIIIFFLVALASFMAVGSVSVFNFAFNLQSVPLSIVGVSYSLAAFPTLSRLFTRGERVLFLEHLQVSARHIIFWSIPISVLFIVLRAQIVRTILGSGNFTWTDTRLTAAALAIFTVSVVLQGLSLLFTRGYYASGNTSKPLVAALLGGAVTISSSVVLMWFFVSFPLFRHFIEALLRVTDVPGTIILVLPLGYSVGMAVSGIVLWQMFESDFPSFSKPIMNTLFQSLASSILSGFSAYMSLLALSFVFDINKFFGIFLQGFFAGLVGIAIWILVLYALGSREEREMWQTLHRKFWKVKTIAPDPKIVP